MINTFEPSNSSELRFYVPPRVVTNQELTQWYDTSDEWITERSGIKERHWVEEGQGPSDLASHALDMALEDANLVKSENVTALLLDSADKFK
jgi:3-oxoacyl-[acyl-carrier-protein] synthase-3